ncbi:MAG: hypothetical protein SGJ19_23915 [Planctomycetia bacterium]|nr:hypothetical protein [Planctomycetia bacterium]
MTGLTQRDFQDGHAATVRERTHEKPWPNVTGSKVVAAQDM